jgi:hypothetical protein
MLLSFIAASQSDRSPDSGLTANDSAPRTRSSSFHSRTETCSCRTCFARKLLVWWPAGRKLNTRTMISMAGQIQWMISSRSGRLKYMNKALNCAVANKVGCLITSNVSLLTYPSPRCCWAMHSRNRRGTHAPLSSKEKV